MKRVAAGILAVGFVLTCSAWAQDDEDPGRGVARVSLINGDVSVRRGDSGDYVAAAINAPLVVQDSLVTGNNSRAEVQLDWANMLRVNANSEIRFAELETRRYQVQVSSGTVTHRVLRDSDAEVEINTPSISVRPVKKGTYRIAVLPNGDTEVTVRSGEVEVYSPRGVERLRSGRTMLARGSANDPEFQVVSAIPYDDWDRWNENRDHDLERSRSYQYVSRDIYGADDLDSYGRWVYAAPYGNVWCPAGTGPGWAPYRAGRWVWIDWYGWSWVSDEPWGWAPYHYGRWFYQGPYGWCWFPGPAYHRHYWSPGLVAFFGWGRGGHVGIGFGSVGWVPLAPYETYHRWYGRGYYGGYRNNVIVNNIRVVNNVNISNAYRNARVNGISGLNGDEFGRGGSARHLRASDIQGASLVHGALPVTPGRESLRLGNREATNIPRGSAREHFFSRRAPAQVERVSFDEQRRGMDRMVRGTFGEHAGNQNAARPGGEVRTAMEPGSRGESANTGRQGWRRMGDTTQPPQAGAASPAAPRTSSDGWNRVGRGQNRQVEPRETGVREAGQGSAQSGGRSAESGNWRRFEGSRGRQVEPRTESRQSQAGPSGNPDWRRLGSGSGSEAQPIDRGRRVESAPAPRNETPRWNRSEPRSEAPRYAAPEQRNEAPRWNRSEPRAEAPRYAAPRSEPIRINPPIVRERAMQRSESSGGGSGRMSAPAYHGGGGSPARSESRGGGGGGDRSGGGRGGRGR